MKRRYFVTGTDTGVGKTLVTAALLQRAGALGLRTVGLKPVAAGGVVGAPGARDTGNEDALLLQAQATVALPYADVNAALLAEAMAPHIAAARAGVALAVAPLAAAVAGVLARAQPDVAFIEGAGGWLCPLNARETLADLAVALRADVVLVVGLRLGCLNHALLTAGAIAGAGLRLAGWVANGIDPDMPVRDENIATLAARLPAPLLGIVPPLGPAPAVGAAAAALVPEPLWAAP